MLEEEKPPAASVNSAKRDLSGSEDSDAGIGKLDMQRMKGEHGAVTRTKTTRSNRWGETHEKMAKELAVDRQQATPRREFLTTCVALMILY